LALTTPIETFYHCLRSFETTRRVTCAGLVRRIKALVFLPALFFAGFSRGDLCARPGMSFVLRAPGNEMFRSGFPNGLCRFPDTARG
jgi:hypothetical protein